jgi:mycothiol S-conjugate amidase
MARAREILGVGQSWLGFVDSGFPEGDPPPPLPEGCFALEPLETASEPLVRAVREFRPHVMLTYDERGGYPHPDHVKCHEVSVEAFEAAGDPERYPGTGDPWQPLKLYYHVSFPRARFEAIAEVMEARGLENPFAEWLERMRERKWPQWEITTQVKCDEYFETRDRGGVSPPPPKNPHPGGLPPGTRPRGGHPPM